MGVQRDSTSTNHSLQKCLLFIYEEVSYNILTEFCILVKLVRPVNSHLNENYSKIRIGKHLSYTFPIQNDRNQGDALLPLLFNFASEYVIQFRTVCLFVCCLET
jgi:hypothetical protein